MNPEQSTVILKWNTSSKTLSYLGNNADDIIADKPNLSVLTKDPKTQIIILLDEYSCSYFAISTSPDFDAAYIKKHPEYLIEEDLLDDITSIEAAAEILPSGAHIYCGDASAIDEIIKQMNLYKHINYSISCIHALENPENPTTETKNSLNEKHTSPNEFQRLSAKKIDLKPKRIKREHFFEKIKNLLSELTGLAAAILITSCLIITVILFIINQRISSIKAELASLSSDTSTTPEEIIERFQKISDKNLKENEKFDNLFLAFCEEFKKIDNRPLISQFYYDKNKLLSIRLKGTTKPAFDAIKNITSDRISVRSGAITTINSETTIDVSISPK